MRISIRYGTKLKKDIWAGKFHCPSCNRLADFYLFRQKQFASVYFIPVFSKTIKHFIVCECCKSGYELERKQYIELRSKQQQCLKNGQFPADIVCKNYNKKELKYGWKVFLLVLSILHCLFEIIGTVQMVSVIGAVDTSVVFGVIMYVAIGVLPMVAAIKLVQDAGIKRTQFKNICG